MKRVLGIFWATLVVALILLLLANVRHDTSIGGSSVVTCPEVVYGETHPTAITEIPRVIPCNGVRINQDEVVLLPASSATSGILSSAHAVAMVHLNFPTVEPSNAVLTKLTVPSTIPIDPNEKIPGTSTPVVFHTVLDHLVWLLTFHASQPENVSQIPNHPVMVSNFQEALDAYSGAFVYGFFTK